MADRTQRAARWTGGLRAVVQAGEFELVADEPESVAGGTGTGPQPTELLLAAVASCFTLALAYSARKRDVALSDLHLDVTGTYDGPAVLGHPDHRARRRPAGRRAGEADRVRASGSAT